MDFTEVITFDSRRIKENQYGMIRGKVSALGEFNSPTEVKI